MVVWLNDKKYGNSGKQRPPENIKPKALHDLEEEEWKSKVFPLKMAIFSMDSMGHVSEKWLYMILYDCIWVYLTIYIHVYLSIYLSITNKSRRTTTCWESSTWMVSRFWCASKNWVWTGELEDIYGICTKAINNSLSGWWFGCHQFYFPIYWVANHPNWRSYFSEGWPNHQPV